MLLLVNIIQTNRIGMYLELDCLCSRCHSQKLMAHTYSKDRYLRGRHDLSQDVDGVLAMRWISRTIANENAIEMLRNLMHGVIERKACH